MGTDSAILLLIADLQRDKEALRAEVARLQGEVEHLHGLLDTATTS